jgi:hypothetical protein
MMPSKPFPYLEEIELPGHHDRPDMAMQDRSWLVHPRNRSAVARLWDRLSGSHRTACGGYGFLPGEQLEDDGIPEVIVSHWRAVEYTDAGERLEQIPGGMIARDLERLGLAQADLMSGTVTVPRPRPSAATVAKVPKAKAPRPFATLSIRRKGEGRPAHA